MKIKVVGISIMGAIFITLTPALAMMGGHGSNDSGNGMGGTMGGNTSADSYNMGKDPIRDEYRRQMLPNSKEVMSPGKAAALVYDYMARQSSEQYELKTIKDHGTYFKADIIRPGGKILKQLLVDKHTGQIHSLD